MTMPPGLRKAALAVHLTCSIGWMGAVLAYLALVVAAMVSREPRTPQAAWVSMALIGWYVIVPLSLGSLLTGLVMSLGTRWGLFRHYWVLFSLVLTAFAVAVLLKHMPTVSSIAGEIARSPMTGKRGLVGEMMHAGLGLFVLIVVQVMNVYKPQGITPYEWRRRREASA